jgi:hypothetical protein
MMSCRHVFWCYGRKYFAIFRFRPSALPDFFLADITVLILHDFNLISGVFTDFEV